MPDPETGPFDLGFLNGVASLSASNAWAVGNYLNDGAGELTLIEHWDATSWKLVASPNR